MYWVAFQAKNSIKSALASTEAIMCILQIVTYAVVEKGMEHKGEQS